MVLFCLPTTSCSPSTSGAARRPEVVVLKSLVLSISLLSASALPAQLLGPADLMAIEVPAADHRISYGADPLQYGHLRLPVGAGPHPVALFVHGGCYLSQFDIAHAAAAEQALAEQGFAVWSLEYRRVGDPGGGWPGTFLDIAAGADHLRDLAGRFELDLGRVVAVGHSAGGNMAIWLAARGKIDRGSDLYRANPLPVQAVLGLAPAPDLEGLHSAGVCGNVVDKLMGGSPEQVPERYRAVSPMQLAPIGVPEVVLVGRHDQSWGPVGRRYFELAEAVGEGLVRLEEAPAAGHFEVIAPSSSTWALVQSALQSLLSAIATVGGQQGAMSASYDLVLAGGRVMDPESGLDAVRDLGMRDGRIAAISSQPLEGRERIEVGGLVVAPGFIDLHEAHQVLARLPLITYLLILGLGPPWS